MAIRIPICFVIMLLLCGCAVPGRLWTDVTMPYSEDFNNTPVGTKKCVLSDHRIKEPVSGYSVSAEWSTDEILKTAREAGITNVYYIDEHTFAIVLGIYKRKNLIIYGD